MTYLNSEVFYRYLPEDACELVPMPPRAMAAAVERGELDAGPLPTAEVIRLGAKVRSLGDLCVAASDQALSVLLFSRRPAIDLDGATIGVTSHTATSIQLLRVLFADHWRVSPGDYVSLEDDHDAALVIGDPALRERSQGRYPFVYDLGEEWKRLTRLPFVYALWVIRADSPRELTEAFERTLLTATERGIRSAGEIGRARATDFMDESATEHYVRNFTYRLGPSEQQAIDEFGNRLSKLPSWRPAQVPGGSHESMTTTR
jgi:chorismate dehydratase